jgi:hypothetical protein
MSMSASAARFWTLVRHGGPDECWPWLGCRNPKGYGMSQVAEVRARTAHRIAWTLLYGAPESDAQFVCHRCDHPWCCNPAHLFLADNAENMRDMYRKKRVDRSGENHPNAKLTAEQAELIRTDPRGLTAMARFLGITIQTVWKIRSGKAWGFEKPATTRHEDGRLKGAAHNMAKLTDADVRAIRAAPKGPHTASALAARYGVTAATIRNIRAGRGWAHL